MKRLHRVLEKFRSLSFRTKIFLSYLLVILFPLLVWNVISYQQANETILRQMNITFDDNFQSTVRQMESKMDILMSRLLFATSDASFGTIVSEVYQNPYKKYYDITNRIDPVLNSMLMFHPEITDIDIYTDGNITDSREMFKNLEELASLDQGDAIRDSVNPVWLAQDNKVFLAKRIFSQENPFAFSVILLRINYSFIFDKDTMPGIQDSGVIVTDQQGNILYQYSNFDPDGNGEHPPEEIFAQAESPTDSRLIVREGPLASGAWRIYMYANTDSLRISPFDSFKTTLFFLLLISALMLFVAVLFSRSFSKRISVLNSYTRGIVRNNFSEDISSDSTDEIGEITNSVGQMVLEARQLIQEVYEARLIQKEAEIKALQSQINPHFLYNTLSSINWLAIYSGNETISRTITNLSIFYRSTLNSGGFVTTIQRELETTRAYVDIQLFIHKNSFDVSFHIEPTVLEYQMPSIILQPIVENAIEHGIGVLPEDVRGEITVSAYEEEHDILFKIFNTGPGLSEEEAANILQSSGKGYGVKNVNDRLKLFFDDTYGITFSSSPSPSPAGLTVTIRIPKYIDLNEEF